MCEHTCAILGVKGRTGGAWVRRNIRASWLLVIRMHPCKQLLCFKIKLRGAEVLFCESPWGSTAFPIATLSRWLSFGTIPASVMEPALFFIFYV
jgi:hypothetical protein